MSTYLLGWDMNQWAIALAWAKAKPQTISDACRVLREWKRYHNHDPQETLIGVKPAKDFAAAYDLLKYAPNEACRV